ncbi:hypothetical protein E4T38_02293 [Aureobasidium subglaciale]|nr:hypothetical protein E4T38_02293 [Aureobasidium subglaciale]KAI5228607.1 hypothetical protein E4T40_02072 [Aureobasidium subglaciale]KAI5231853.1 hypothetical protein E4T41_02292 [Aureobasidium subglaciale]KAI5265773.1 hypothetical protein E4T46_02070 [Aureobasidium subglaciale]
MVRAGSRAPSVGQSSVSKIRDRRNKKSYKVQLESVVTRKKKLKLLDIQGSAQPKEGYTFLPVGYADLAERCKEKSRQLGVDVAVVSAGTRRSGPADPLKLTHHVHRVGYHFRSDIFDQACNFLGYREVNGKLIRDTGFDTTSRFERTVARFAPRIDLNVNTRSSEQSTKVKEYIRELFPKIPEADLEEIYKRAWEQVRHYNLLQGTTTVGNASDLSLSRQVQLATIARIRHTYTDYDKLLKIVSWKEARQIVEPISLTKLIEWRGEHDNDTEDFEEILRETIVIDDDDELEDAHSDTDSNVAASGDDGSDTSLEILQQTIAPKDLNVAVGERARNVVASVGRAAGRALPAAIQTRWRDARMRHQAIMPPSQGGQISVPLDQRGNVPRKVVSAGVEYVRISSSPEPGKGQHPHRSMPGAWPTVDDALVSEQRRGPPVHGHHANQGLGSSSAPQYTSVDRTSNDVPRWDRIERRPMYPTIGTPFVDLTSPSTAARGGYGDRISYAGPPEFGYRPHEPAARVAVTPRGVPHRNVYRPGMFNDDVTIAGAQAGPKGRHQLYNYGETRDRVEVLKPEDYPIPSREIPYPALDPHHERSEVNVRAPLGINVQTRPLQRQPEYGQPAYPQMRSQTVAMQVVPRPVHGAPAAVQPMPPHERGPSVGQAASSFGAPSPQRYFTGSSHQPYYVPDR